MDNTLLLSVCYLGLTLIRDPHPESVDLPEFRRMTESRLIPTSVARSRIGDWSLWKHPVLDYSITPAPDLSTWVQ